MTALRVLFGALVARFSRRDLARLAMTLSGIAIGVATLLSIQLVNASALRSFSETVELVAGRANWQIASDVGAMDERTLLRLQSLWPLGVRFAPVIDRDGMYESSEPIRILAVDLLSDIHFRDYRYATVMRANRDPRPGDAAWFLELLEDDSVVLPDGFAESHGLRVGQRVRLELNGRNVAFTLRGILESEGPGAAFGGNIAILDIATAQRAFGLGGELSRIDLMIPAGIEDSVVEDLRGSLRTPLRIERPSRRSERAAEMLEAFRTNLTALAGISVLVGMFLVHNTVLLSYLRRRRTVAMLRTLGVSRSQIATVFVLEGVLLGVLGSLLGIALGVLMARSILSAVSTTINALYLPTNPSNVNLTPELVLWAFAIGVAVSLLSSLQPALEASRSSPLQHRLNAMVGRVSTGRIWLFAGAAVATGIAAWLLSLVPPIDGRPLGGYGSVLAIVVTLVLGTPAVLYLSARFLRPIFKRLWGAVGAISAGSAIASLRRIAVATAALATAVAMVIAVALMVGSFRSTVEIWMGQTLQSDLWIRPARNLSNAAAATFPAAIAADVEKIGLIAAFDRIRGRELIWNDLPIYVGGSDFDVASRYGQLPMLDGVPRSVALREAVGRDGVVISESLARRHRLGRGSEIELPVRDGSRCFPVTGVYRDYSTDRGVVVMDRGLYQRLYSDDGISTIAVYLRDGVDPKSAGVEIQRELSKWNAFVFTNRTIRQEVMKIFDETFRVTWVLLAIAVAVAVLGTFNTLGAIILERKREIALLRVAGLTRRQIRTMIVLESVPIGLTAIVIGAAAGWVIALVLVYVINVQSFGWTIDFSPPWTTIGLTALIVAASVLASGIFAAKLVDTIDPAREVRAE